MVGRAGRSYSVEARYPFQVWELEVPLERERLLDGGALDWLAERFHDAHERTFAVREPGQRGRVRYWKGRLTAPLDAPALETHRSGRRAGAAAHAAARYFEATGVVDTPCYGPAALRPGTTVDGPGDPRGADHDGRRPARAAARPSRRSARSTSSTSRESEPDR